MVTEVAVVRIKAGAESRVDEVMTRLRRVMGSRDGFAGWRQLRSEGLPLVITDILEWRSLEIAEKASEQMQQTPEGVAYAELMEEVVSFGHYVTAFEEAG